MPEDPPEQTIGQDPAIAGPDPDTQAYLNSIATAERLERILAGPLPCVVCRYDLRGISIRGLCPECGTATDQAIIRQTLPRSFHDNAQESPAIGVFSVVEAERQFI